MGKYFGTDGFRGEANVALTVDHAFKVGRYLGWYYGKEHRCRVAIGKISLGHLPVGKWRPLSEQEVAYLSGQPIPQKATSNIDKKNIL